jgi:hypothetical protein
VSAPPGLTSTVFVLAVFLVLVLRRAYRTARGTRLSRGRLFVYAGFYLLLLVAQLFLTYLILPWWTVPLDLGVVAVGAVLFTGYTRRRVEIYQDPKGRWMYRLGAQAAVLYVVLYVLRIALEVVYFPSFVSFGPPTGAPPSIGPLAVGILLLVDTLLSLSTGFLLGRLAGIELRYGELLRNPPVSPPSERGGGTPLPSGKGGTSGSVPPSDR